jgi:glucosamine-6-phosphate deaminase
VTADVFASEEDVAEAVARRLIDAIRQRPTLALGLPTGRTPLALYDELIRRTRAESVDWSSIRTFNLDEFVGLGRGDPGSYRTFMQKRLFDHVNITPANIGFLDGRAGDLAAECARYEAAIDAVGRLDVVILGIGANGHIGFNEPADALVARTHRAVLDEPTRAANAWSFDGDVRRVPAEALTMGMATILSARTIVLMATGEGKADAVAAAMSGGITTALPASFLQLHSSVTVMLDEAAHREIREIREHQFPP